MYPGDLINKGGGATYFKPQGALINKPLMPPIFKGGELQMPQRGFKVFWFKCSGGGFNKILRGFK